MLHAALESVFVAQQILYRCLLTYGLVWDHYMISQGPSSGGTGDERHLPTADGWAP